MPTAAPEKPKKRSVNRRRLKKLGLRDGTYDWSQAPKPTGGELVTDDTNYLIHGVSLIAHDSRNGFRWAPQALDAVVRLINARRHPLPVQSVHHDPHAPEMGGVCNAYVDETGERPVVRVSWILNPHNNAMRWIYNAENTPSNVMFSLEAWERTIDEAGSSKGPLVTSVTGIRWVALTKWGGSTSSLNESFEEPEMALPKTPSELRAQAPDLYEAIIAESAEAAETTDLAAQLEALTKERDSAIASLQEAEAKEKLASRTAEIKAEFAEMLKDVDLSRLPTDSKIAAKAGLTDKELASMASADVDEVTEALKSRFELIEEACGLVLAESGEGADTTYVIQSEENNDSGAPGAVKQKLGTVLTFGV